MTVITVNYKGFNDLAPEIAIERLQTALKSARLIKRAADNYNKAEIAQSAVHFLGKEKVAGSSPALSSKKKK